MHASAEAHILRFGDFTALDPARIRELAKIKGLEKSADVADIVARMNPR